MKMFWFPHKYKPIWNILISAKSFNDEKSLTSVFSRKSNSRITNVRLSVTKTPQPLRIAPINH